MKDPGTFKDKSSAMAHYIDEEVVDSRKKAVGSIDDCTTCTLISDNPR